MAIIKYTLGMEKQPKIEDLSEYFSSGDSQNGRTDVVNDQSLFFSVYSKSLKLIQEALDEYYRIVKIKGNRHENLIDSYHNEWPKNNIIAYIGDRGSGKSSCMLSVYYALRKAVIKTKNTDREIRFYTLPIIDPSYFNKGNNILLIIVSIMFKNLQSYLSNANLSNARKDESVINQKRELVRLFDKTKKAIDTIMSRGSEKKSLDSLEDLANISDSIDLKEELAKLVTQYLKFTEKDILVIAIDDIDQELTHAYEMIEQIRKYFIMPNVIILMAAKIEQLSDAIESTHLKYYKDLHPNNYSEALKDIADKHLTKLIPFSNRIVLSRIRTGYDKIEIDGRLEQLDDYILSQIYHKTGLMFYNTLEDHSLIVPINLREILYFIGFLERMNDIQLENRMLFQQYFIRTWCANNLPLRQYKLIKKLPKQKPTQVNKFVIQFLNEEYGTRYQFREEVVSGANRTYNVSLGDVVYMLDKVLTVFRSAKNLVFAIKVIYNILLHDLRSQMIISLNKSNSGTTNLYYRVS